MTIEKIKLGKNMMYQLIFKVSSLLKSSSFNKEILQAGSMLEQLKVINKHTTRISR